ncbi:MAG: FtsX-like permease family protein [Bacteroidales bacterium]|nr:FtsX-like permease family protein [Bacteroidales bacterium]
MKFPLYIASRYFKGGKSWNIIHWVSLVSLLGVSTGTAALIIVLSVFNGFEDIIRNLYNTFDPELKITLVQGKSFSTDSIPILAIRNIDGVLAAVEVIEEKVLMKYREKQYISTLKGLSADFEKVKRIDSMMIDGSFYLGDSLRDFIIPGAGVAYYLSVGLNDPTHPIELYSPSRRKGGMTNIAEAFNRADAFPSGIFSIQQDFDLNYTLAPISLAEKLTGYENRITSVEVYFIKEQNARLIKQKIQDLCGNQYVVSDRDEQQKDLVKIMKTEKWAIFIILTFILIIASFNVISSLSMIILDKRKDIAILLSMGAGIKKVQQIFLFEGLLISLGGAILGLMIGGIIAWAQQTYGFVSLQTAGGSFVIDKYPVRLDAFHFLAVFLVVTGIGFIAAWLPARSISKIGSARLIKTR